MNRKQNTSLNYKVIVLERSAIGIVNEYRSNTIRHLWLMHIMIDVGEYFWVVKHRRHRAIFLLMQAYFAQLFCWRELIKRMSLVTLRTCK